VFEVLSRSDDADSRAVARLMVTQGHVPESATPTAASG
jgi:hypothetical protein